MNSNILSLARIAKELSSSSESNFSFIKGLLGDEVLQGSTSWRGHSVSVEGTNLIMDGQEVTSVQDLQLDTVIADCDASVLVEDLNIRSRTQDVLASICTQLTTNSRLLFTTLMPSLQQIPDVQMRNDMTSALASVTSSEGYITQGDFLMVVNSYMSEAQKEYEQESLSFPTREGYLIESFGSLFSNYVYPIVSTLATALLGMISPILSMIASAITTLGTSLMNVLNEVTTIKVDAACGNSLMEDPGIMCYDSTITTDTVSMCPGPGVLMYSWPYGNGKAYCDFIDLSFDARKWFKTLKSFCIVENVTVNSIDYLKVSIQPNVNLLKLFGLNAEGANALVDDYRLTDAEYSAIITNQSRLEKHILLTQMMQLLTHSDIDTNGVIAIQKKRVNSAPVMPVFGFEYNESMGTACMQLLHFIGLVDASIFDMDISSFYDNKVKYVFSLSFAQEEQRIQDSLRSLDQKDIKGVGNNLYTDYSGLEDGEKFISFTSGKHPSFYLSTMAAIVDLKSVTSLFDVHSYPLNRAIKLPTVTVRAISQLLTLVAVGITTAVVTKCIVKRWWGKVSSKNQLKYSAELKKTYDEWAANPTDKKAYSKYVKSSKKYSRMSKIFGFANYDPLNDWFESETSSSSSALSGLNELTASNDMQQSLDDLIYLIK